MSITHRETTALKPTMGAKNKRELLWQMMRLKI